MRVEYFVTDSLAIMDSSAVTPVFFFGSASLNVFNVNHHYIAKKSVTGKEDVIKITTLSL